MPPARVIAVVCLASTAALIASCSILLDPRDDAAKYAAGFRDGAVVPATDSGVPLPGDGGGTHDGGSIEAGVKDGGNPKVDSGVDAGGPGADGGIDGGAANACGPTVACIAPSSMLNRSFDGRAGTELQFNTLTCSVAFLGTFTVEFWFKETGTTILQIPLLQQSSGRDGWNVFLDVGPQRDGVAFQILTGGTPQEMRTARLLLHDVWHHVAIEGVATPTTLSVVFFFDGAPALERLFAVTAPVVNVPLILPGNGTNPFHLDELRVSSIQRYPRGQAFTPPRTMAPDSETIGLWTMDESDISLTASDSACRHHGTSLVPMSFVSDFPQ